MLFGTSQFEVWKWSKLGGENYPKKQTKNFSISSTAVTNEPRDLKLGYKSRQNTSSGGRLSASGITCKRIQKVDPQQDVQRRSAEATPSLRTHPGVPPVYFHSSWNPERLIAAGHERAPGSKQKRTHYTWTICWGGLTFIREGNEASFKLKIQ